MRGFDFRQLWAKRFGQSDEKGAQAFFYQSEKEREGIPANANAETSCSKSIKKEMPPCDGVCFMPDKGAIERLDATGARTERRLHAAAFENG